MRSPLSKKLHSLPSSIRRIIQPRGWLVLAFSTGGDGGRKPVRGRIANAKRVGWAIYAAGFAIWLFGYLVGREESFCGIGYYKVKRVGQEGVAKDQREDA